MCLYYAYISYTWVQMIKSNLCFCIFQEEFYGREVILADREMVESMSGMAMVMYEVKRQYKILSEALNTIHTQIDM